MVMQQDLGGDPVAGAAVLDVMRVALRAAQGAREPDELERPLGIADRAIMNVLNAVMPGRRCSITGAMLGFGDDATIAAVAGRRGFPLTPDLLRELRAMEFAFMSVVGA